MSRSVVITGAASGLGLALARIFGAAGWQLMLGDISDVALAGVVKELQERGLAVSSHHCDVRNENDVNVLVDTAVREYGKLDMIINNAGVAAFGAIDEQAMEDWQWVIDINLLGVVRGCKVASKVFKRQGHGHIVNIASMAGLINSPEMAAYNAGKAAVVSLSESLKIELTAYGIDVSVVCPGYFKTGLGQNIRSPNPKADKALEKMMSGSAITADDIARMVLEETEKKTFYILPHKDYRKWWLMKRFAPRYYFSKMQEFGAVLAAKKKNSQGEKA